MAAKGSKSKKQSVASSKPHNLPIFFLDRALGNKVIAEALRAAGATVHVHSDHFAADAPDEEWLTHVGQHGWIVLTKDTKIQRRIIERNALINARVSAFVLVSGNLTGREMAEIFVQALEAITRYVENHPPPFIVKVFRSGNLEAIDIVPGP